MNLFIATAKTFEINFATKEEREIKKMRNNYKYTIYASYLGYVTQAIVNNLAPLLFITFQKSYNLSFEQIGLLVTVNFGVQLLVDLFSAKFIDKIGYRISIVAAHILAAIGLAGLSILPELLSKPYEGLMLAVSIYAVGGGIIEVLISPIVEACPTKEKSSQMSLLHSFYCWGQVLLVLGSTLYFNLIGIDRWKILTLLWAIIPLINAIFYLLVPINHLTDGKESISMKRLFSTKLFWLFMLLMVCAGASELSMSQWASAFAEEGLGVSKTVGDLMGPCMFAILMGTSRLLYSKYSKKIRLRSAMIAGGVLCVISYFTAVISQNAMLSLIGCGLCGFAVGIMWTGVFSLSSELFPTGGTAMFALLALAGDVGCSIGPTLVGKMVDVFNGSIRSGLSIAIIFPVALLIGLRALPSKTKKDARGSA